MRLELLCLVFLLSRELRNVHSLVGRPKLSELLQFITHNHNGSPSSQSPSGSSYNPCESAKVKNGALGGHTACHNECLAVRLQISFVQKVHPNNKTIKYIYDYCGVVTEGMCGTGGLFSICSCYSPNGLNGLRRASLFFCRGSLQIIRFFTHTETTGAGDGSNVKMSQSVDTDKEAYQVGMFSFSGRISRQQSSGDQPDNRHSNRYSPYADPRAETSRSNVLNPSGSVRGPSVGPSSSYFGSSSSQAVSLPPQGGDDDFNWKSDNQPEGNLLWTNVRLARIFVIRALLDTGCGFSMIHEKFAPDMVKMTGQTFRGGDSQEHTIFGRHTLTMEIRNGITITLAGYVTDRQHEILLGIDFFSAYAAKIRIEERTMELTTGQGKVTLRIRFRFRSNQVNMVHTDHRKYTSLKISVRLEGVDTKMKIDTGATLTLVNARFSDEKNLRKTDVTCSFMGSGPVSLKGTTNVSIFIGKKSLRFNAFVPHVELSRDIVVGNDFIKQYVGLIDFESPNVILKFPQISGGYKPITTKAFFKRKA